MPQHARAEAEAALVTRAALHALAERPNASEVWWRLGESFNQQLVILLIGPLPSLFFFMALLALIF